MQDIPESLKVEIMRLLTGDDRINALKAYREATNTDLKEAMRAIEVFEAFIRQSNARDSGDQGRETLSQEQARADLKKHFPHLAVKTSKLDDAGYELADLCRGGKLSEEQALSELKRRFPHLSDEVCKSALGKGFFDSR
jgi:hypothetical protein